MIDFEFPEPPRLAVGSHVAGTGFACAMNVLSWENGDAHITDLPACTAPPLAALVQRVNDRYCAHLNIEAGPWGGYTATVLCPDCSVAVLDLAHRTVGTNVQGTDHLRPWMTDVLDHMRAQSARRGRVSFLAGAILQDALLEVATMDLATPLPRSGSNVNGELQAAAFRLGVLFSDSLTDREAMLTGAHRAIDSWEEHTGVVAGTPNRELVLTALAESRKIRSLA